MSTAAKKPAPKAVAKPRSKAASQVVSPRTSKAKANPSAAPPRRKRAPPQRPAAPANFHDFSKSANGGHTMTPRILFIDLAERDRIERETMMARIGQLQAIDRTQSTSGGLTPDLKAELRDLLVHVDQDGTTDPLFQAVASQIAGKPWDVLHPAANRDSDPETKGHDAYVLKYGFMGSQRFPEPQSLGPVEREIIAVCGLMQLDNLTDPAYPRFTRKVTEARGEYDENRALFDQAFRQFAPRFAVSLQSQISKGFVCVDAPGCISPDVSPSFRAKNIGKPLIPSVQDQVFALSARTTAAIVRRLAADNISPNDPWLASRMDNAFNLLTGSIEGAPPSAIEIMLPDLEESVDVEIAKENLYAIQAIYFSYQLEEMRMFQVVEKIVELFRQGMLPLGKGSVGDYLFNYFKSSSERITEAERRDLYLRAFGAPGGNPNGGEPNRDFNELWLRFISSVSSFARQISVERILRNSVPMGVNQEAVRKAARDLGTNLSRNGYGIAYFAATELQQTILKFRDVLQDQELRSAFGARDMWQVIDQVNVNYLGGAKNTHRFRTQSRAGAIIIRWIANHVQRLANISSPVLSIDAISNPQLQISAAGHNPTVDPSDWDLVNACEQWLAVAGMQDSNVEQYSQPIEAPTMTSRPMQMPQAARDVLASVGVNLPG